MYLINKKTHYYTKPNSEDLIIRVDIPELSNRSRNMSTLRLDLTGGPIF